MRCRDAQILLSTRRDLNMSQRAELDAHLGVCRACAAARREEEHVSRLLAQLPDPGLAPPPRMAATIAARAARRSVAARRRRSLALATSLSATVIVVALLLNIVAGGRLGWLLFGAPEAQTGTQPESGPPAASANGDTLYLIHQPAGSRARVIAWKPATDKALFSVPLGNPPVYALLQEGGAGLRIDVQVAPRDVALAPDGDSLYVIEYQADGPALVAYDTQRGEERWRTALAGYTPFVTPESSDNLSVSPDGARVFVRGVAPGTAQTGRSLELELRAFAAADGRELEPAVELPSQTIMVLPVSQHSALTVTASGFTRRTPLDGARRLPIMIEAIAAAVLLPDGRTLHAVTPDLRVLEIVLLGEALRVASDTDLMERGGFFFDHAAFSPDGQVLAVGQNTWDVRTGALGSEVRIYRAGPWREVARHTLNRPLNGLAVSADGQRVYGVMGAAGMHRWMEGVRRLTPTPGAAPTAGPSPRGALAIFDLGLGQLVATQALDPAIVGVLAGR